MKIEKRFVQCTIITLEQCAQTYGIFNHIFSMAAAAAVVVVDSSVRYFRYKLQFVVYIGGLSVLDRHRMQSFVIDEWFASNVNIDQFIFRIFFFFIFLSRRVVFFISSVLPFFSIENIRNLYTGKSIRFETNDDRSAELIHIKLILTLASTRSSCGVERWTPAKCNGSPTREVDFFAARAKQGPWLWF